MMIVEIMGHLGRDPETRFTTTGQKVTNLTVATNTRENGKDETVWWQVTIWGDRFDKMMPYLKKGSAIIARGPMRRTRVYTDKAGVQQLAHEMTAEMLHFSPFGKSERAEGGATTAQQPAQQAGEPSYTSQAAGGFGTSTPYAGNTPSTFKPVQNAPEDEHIPF